MELQTDGKSLTEERERLLEQARAGRYDAAEKTEALRASLPIAYLSQQAHLTAPASDARLAEKALADPYGVCERLLAKYGLGAEDVARTLGVAPIVVEEVLASGGAPVVLLDLEDGVAPQAVPEARANAVRLSREVDRGPSLCYVRTAGVSDPRCADDLLDILLPAGEGIDPSAYPIDGIVVAKVRHVHEIEWLSGVLDQVELALGLAPNRIRMSLQIETAWGLLNLGELVLAARERLSGLILGTVDLGADLLLPEVEYRHPVSEWARIKLVAAAGAVGVPAIDGMTLDFPVGRPELSDEENRELVLERMRSNFDDATYSIRMGMSGRWVGHPLQLLATVLAFRAMFSPEAIAAEVEKLSAFSAAITDGDGAALGAQGELMDLATDRHVRNLLRRATAWGLIPMADAYKLDLVTSDEIAAAAE